MGICFNLKGVKRKCLFTNTFFRRVKTFSKKIIKVLNTIVLRHTMTLFFNSPHINDKMRQ